MNLQPVSRNASSWLNNADMDEDTGMPGVGSLWLADNSSAEHWLYLDLGEKKTVTGERATWATAGPLPHSPLQLSQGPAAPHPQQEVTLPAQLLCTF